MKNLFFPYEKNLTMFDIENDYILFEIAEEIYAIKILDIKEIVSNRNIVEVDDLPENIVGFANIRNVIFPIFDLKKNLPLENMKKYGKYSVIIIFDDPFENIALLADNILDIYNISKDSFIEYNKNQEYIFNFIDFEVELNNQAVKIINSKKIIKLKYQI